MKKWFFWLLPLSWMGVIFYASGQPYEKQDLKPFFSEYLNFSFLEPFVDSIVFTYHNSEVSVEALGINGFIEFFIRKGAHFGVFFLLFLFFILAFRKSTAFSNGKIGVLSFVFTVLYAITDEIHQGFTPNRTPYAGDIIIDTIGAVFGTIFYAFFLKFSRS
ncbi:VanZ family protein [Salirhabdus euzebyi]|uniref:VanZ family protein n=1 Tax=Salirhabdus euzebyi TaxID=394506 RepID=A0A841Q598_9BACI|nr:VanZ family protein [Salirhabdus euzebyi]MBB6453639.1 VanZ family protein [Salirhabdus euzebyi]